MPRWRRGGRIAEYFYDSWSIIAHLASPKLKPYFRAGRGRTTWLNLMEVYWVLLREGKSGSEANEIVSSFNPYLMEFTFEEVQDAMELRLKWHEGGRRISYVDAIGYSLARDRHMQFLTGDPAFRRIPGVAFIGIPK